MRNGTNGRPASSALWGGFAKMVAARAARPSRSRGAGFRSVQDKPELPTTPNFRPFAQEAFVAGGPLDCRPSPDNRNHRREIRPRSARHLLVVAIQRVPRSASSDSAARRTIGWADAEDAIEFCYFDDDSFRQTGPFLIDQRDIAINIALPFKALQPVRAVSNLPPSRRPLPRL
jgi:hypothetical protein